MKCRNSAWHPLKVLHSCPPHQLLRLPLFQLLFIPLFHCFSFIFSFITSKFNQCCLYVHGVWSHTMEHGNLPVATPTKMILLPPAAINFNSSSLRSWDLKSSSPVHSARSCFRKQRLKSSALTLLSTLQSSRACFSGSWSRGLGISAVQTKDPLSSQDSCDYQDPNDQGQAQVLFQYSADSSIKNESVVGLGKAAGWLL